MTAPYRTHHTSSTTPNPTKKHATIGQATRLLRGQPGVGAWTEKLGF
ncbi:MAG: hypothetical protein HC929_06700 [Leptolyngbyaceae cyanobacterium SM2_5_2]|nr:hypothetical protein [Leptolyngbyaceae cyanobacterium SM2_5_2]